MIVITSQGHELCRGHNLIMRRQIKRMQIRMWSIDFCAAFRQTEN